MQQQDFLIDMIGRAVVAGLVVTMSTSAAMANFAGGGTVFGFTEACSAHGFQTNGAIGVNVRYVDTEDDRNQNSSQVTIAMPSGTFHYALWQSPMAETGTNFLGGAGRSTFTVFHFAANRPQIRVLQRRVVSLVDPGASPTIENARSVVLRLRIQNFSDLPGCAATLAATMRRR